MSGVEWMVLIVGLGLGWGVVSMLTGQRKRPPPARTEGDADPAAAESTAAGQAQSAPNAPVDNPAQTSAQAPVNGPKVAPQDTPKDSP
jgi:hypothetical protein